MPQPTWSPWTSSRSIPPRRRSLELQAGIFGAFSGAQKPIHGENGQRIRWTGQGNYAAANTCTLVFMGCGFVEIWSREFYLRRYSNFDQNPTSNRLVSCMLVHGASTHRVSQAWMPWRIIGICTASML